MLNYASNNRKRKRQIIFDFINVQMHDTYVAQITCPNPKVPNQGPQHKFAAVFAKSRSKQVANGAVSFRNLSPPSDFREFWL